MADSNVLLKPPQHHNCPLDLHVALQVSLMILFAPIVLQDGPVGQNGVVPGMGPLSGLAMNGLYFRLDFL